MRERRRNWRKSTMARVKLSHSVFGELRGATVDISDSGVFVTLSRVPKLPLGSHVNLQFVDSANPELRFNAKVVRQTRDGVALRLVDYEFRGSRYGLDELRDQWSMFTEYDGRF